MISAIFSSISPLLKLFRMDMNDRMQLDMNKIVVPAVISSMIVPLLSFIILSEVSTTKHNPNKLDEALSICGDFCSFIDFLFVY